MRISDFFRKHVWFHLLANLVAMVVATTIVVSQIEHSLYRWVFAGSIWLIPCTYIAIRAIRRGSVFSIWCDAFSEFRQEKQPRSNQNWVSGILCVNNRNFYVSVSVTDKALLLHNQLALDYKFISIPWSSVSIIQSQARSSRSSEAVISIKSARRSFSFSMPWIEEFEYVLPKNVGFVKI